MKRFHLFEFEDQSWFPNVIRQGITDYLQFASNKINLYQSLIPIIKIGRLISLDSGLKLMFYDQTPVIMGSLGFIVKL